MTPYTVVAGGIVGGNSRDVLVVRAPAASYVAIRRVTVSLDQDAADHVGYELYTGTAASGGTAVQANRTDGYLAPIESPSAPASGVGTKALGGSAYLIQGYSGSCTLLPSSTTTAPSAPLIRKSLPLAYGWEWCDASIGLGLAPGEFLILHQVGTTTQPSSVTVEFEVLS